MVTLWGSRKRGCLDGGWIWESGPNGILEQHAGSPEIPTVE